MARSLLADIDDVVLPDGNLLIAGLPPALMAVPNLHDGKPDFPGRWVDWHAEMVAYRTELHGALGDSSARWDAEIAHIREHGAPYFTCMHLTLLEPRTGQRFSKGYHPFIPTPLQVRVLDFLAARRRASRVDPVTLKPGYGHGVIDKPREVGVTVTVTADAFYGWMFEDVWDEMLMSAKEELVDKKGQRGTIFAKFDIFRANLPPPLWPPPGWKEHKHRNHMELINPVNGNVLNGTATTPHATRSNRLTQFIGDEAAFWPVLKEAYEAVIGAVDVSIWLSSASEQISADFAEILDNTTDTQPQAVLTISHEEHPFFDAAWLESKDEKFSVLGAFGKDAIKREIHRMGAAGIKKFIYPEAMTVPLTGLPIDPNRETLMALDPGRDDEFAITVWQERGMFIPGETEPPIDLVWGWMDKGKDARFIASMLTGLPLTGPKGYAYEDKDLAFALLCGRLGRVSYFGCPGGDQKGPNGESWYTQIDLDAQQISNGLIRLVISTSHKNKDRYFPGRRESLRGMIKRMRCLNHPVPLLYLRAIQQNEYQRRSRQRPGITEAWEDEHNWTSHPTATAEYLAVHLGMRHDVGNAMARQGKPGHASIHGLEMPTVSTVPTMNRGW